MVTAELLRKHGWHVVRFDMSRIIPQKRVRLIAYKRFGGLAGADSASNHNNQ
jgi:hypothetical protein